jgi:probable rRNA maturation factor
LLTELFPDCSHELGVYYVNRKKITQMNEKFLGHAGPTDVITFDYRNARKVERGVPAEPLHGEIFICIDEALTQAKAFETTPQMEIVRYLIHGLLHLRGDDDRNRAQRKKMKTTEDKWVRWVAAKFPCDKVWSRKRAG